MKTLGIVGGIGPESTVEYYRFILDGCRKRATDGRAPHIVIDSSREPAIEMLDANDLAGVAGYLGESVGRLARAGAEPVAAAARAGGLRRFERTHLPRVAPAGGIATPADPVRWCFDRRS